PVEYIWILNPDARPAPDALSWLVATADQNPSAALVASRLVSADGASILYDGATIDPVTGATALVGSGEPVQARPALAFSVTDYAHGASMLVRSESLATTGLIPEDYFLYFEETDLAMRARSAGFTVLVEPRSSVRHFRRSWAALPSSTYLYYMVRNRELFSARWGFDRSQARSVTDDFTGSWRRRVGAARPDLLATFDALVSAATSDGEAGHTGASEHPQALELV
ncbi:MAG: glycosyltransferase family 2 protein, partial [Candidatus Nanopelagicales bacterium]